MADGKITIEVEVNGKKLASLSSDLKKIESDARKSGDGFKKASDKIKEAGDRAKNSSQGFKEAGDKVKMSSESAKTGSDGFKIAGDRTKQAGDVAKGAGQGFDEAGEKAKNSGEKAKQGAGGFESLAAKIKAFSVGAVAFKTVSAGMDLVKASMDRAISRFDTLERYPKVMKSLGFSTKEVSSSTKLLSEGIEGLPTTLDDVVKTTQQLTAMTGDLRTSTKLTLALNNAFLASGASTEDASRGLQQFSQMLAAGKVDMQSWKTLQETMPYALQKTAESFGFAGESAQKDFYSALQDGQVTFKDFSKRLIELNKGTNGFAEMARKNSEGIQTSFNNIINAVAKGVANVIKAFDEMSKAVTGKSIAENLNGIKAVINNVFKSVTDSIKSATPVIKTIAQVLGYLKPVFDALTPVIMGAISGIVAYKTAMLGLAIINGVKGWLGGLVQSFLSFISTAKAAEGASLTFGTALSSLSTAGVAVAVGALIGLVSWLTRETEEQKKAKEATEKHKESLKQLDDKIAQGKETYEDRRREIKATADDNERLIKKIEELSHVEKKTAKQKKELATAAQTLNQRIDGLNIAYDKATGTINMTADAIRKQVTVSKQAAEAEAANQRMIEIAKQKLEVESKLSEVKKKLKESEDKVSESLDKAGIKEVALKQIRDEAGKQIKGLEKNLKDLESQYDATAEVASQAAAKEAAAVEESSGRQQLRWETMNDAQRSFVENMRSQLASMTSEVQNAFQAIEQQAVVSTDQMIANLQTNIDAVDQWATNLEQLAARGLDQGLIEKLREAGPKAAAQTQALVESSDEQLQSLNGKWTEAGDKAKEGFLRGLNAAGAELPSEVQAMVTAIGDEFRAALSAAGFDVQGREVTQKIGEGISSSAGDLAQSAAQAKESVKSGLAPMPEEARQKGAEAGRNIAGAILNTVDEVSSSAFTVKNQAISQFETFGSDGTVAGAAFGAGVASGVTSSAQTVVTQSAAMSAGIITQMGTLGTQGTESGAAFGSAVAGGVTSTLGETNSAAQGIKDGANKEMSSLSDDGKQSGQKLGSGVAGGINNKKGAVSNSSKGLKQSAMTQFSDNYSGGYRAGSAIGEGMTAGIYSMADSVATAAASIASGALGAAKSRLRVNSPSKVFRDEVGRAIPEGWAVGIEKYSWYVYDSMKDLSRGVISSGKQFASGFNLGLPKSAEFSSGLNDSLISKAQLSHSDSNGFEGFVQKIRDKADELTQQALELADEAVKRPVNLIVDSHALVATTGDTMSAYYEDKLKIDNRMRGIL